MANDYDTDGPNTVTLRVSPSTLVATVEGLSKFHYGDTVTFVAAGLKVADPSTLEFMAASEAGGSLAQLSGGSEWASVPGSSTRVYAKYAFDTDAAQALAASLALGAPAPIRLYLRDTAGRMIVDQEAEFFRTPYPVSGDQDPAPVSSMVSKASLAAALASVAAMPAANATQLMLKLDALVANLTEITE